MYDLYSLIKELCKKKGTTVSAMCLDLGMSKGVMSDLKNGRKKTLSSKTISAISSYFGVTTDYILGLVDEYGLTPDDWRAMGHLYENHIQAVGKNVSECVDGNVVTAKEAEDFIQDGTPVSLSQLNVLCGFANTTAPDLFYVWADRLWGKKNKPAAEGDGLEYLSEKERALLHSYRTMTEEQVNAMGVFIRGIKKAD